MRDISELHVLGGNSILSPAVAIATSIWQVSEPCTLMVLRSPTFKEFVQLLKYQGITLTQCRMLLAFIRFSNSEIMDAIPKSDEWLIDGTTGRVIEKQ